MGDVREPLQASSLSVLFFIQDSATESFIATALGFSNDAAGLCRVVAGGTCATSPNYPMNYGGGQTCTLTVRAAAPIRVTVAYFNTEGGWDKLKIGNVEYSGPQRRRGFLPPSIPFNSSLVNNGDTISWHPDGGTEYNGWYICLGSVPPADANKYASDPITCQVRGSFLSSESANNSPLIS